MDAKIKWKKLGFVSWPGGEFYAKKDGCKTIMISNGKKHTFLKVELADRTIELRETRK